MAEAAYIDISIEVARPQVTAADPDPLEEVSNPINVVVSFNGRKGIVTSQLSDYSTYFVQGPANITTQYRMVYVDSANTITESSALVTDASGNLIIQTAAPLLVTA